jgi:hypothetical protein
MNGLPWCGVEMVVSESGVCSSGRTLEMRYRQSSPPIECAIRFTPRPCTRAERAWSSSCARSTMDAVLWAQYQRGRSGRRGRHARRDGRDEHLRKISSTFFQLCTCIFGNAAGPRASESYSPTHVLRTELRARMTGPVRLTVTEADEEGQAPERREERGAREQRMQRVIRVP